MGGGVFGNSKKTLLPKGKSQRFEDMNFMKKSRDVEYLEISRYIWRKLSTEAQAPAFQINYFLIVELSKPHYYLIQYSQIMI